MEIGGDKGRTGGNIGGFAGAASLSIEDESVEVCRDDVSESSDGLGGCEGVLRPFPLALWSALCVLSSGVMV